MHGLILAGGQATRLGGGDKPLRPLGDGVMLDHIVRRLAPQVQALAISANGDPARFVRWRLPVLPDETQGQGPLAGMLAGLRWAAGEGATWLLTLPGDIPFPPPDLAARLAAAARPVAIATSGGQDHPAISVIAAGLAADLADALAQGTRAIRDWLAPLNVARVDWPTAAGDPFQNVNTPAELAAADARARAHAPAQPAG